MEKTITLNRKTIEAQKDLYTDLYIAARDYDTMLSDKPSYLQSSACIMSRFFSELLEENPGDSFVYDETIEDWYLENKQIREMIAGLYKSLNEEIEREKIQWNF